MASYHEEDQVVRRRGRIPFFDIGDHDADDAKERVKRSAGIVRQAVIPPLKLLLGGIGVVLFTLVFTGLALRMLGLTCKVLPLPFCSRPFIVLQEPLVDRVEDGTTPLTKPLVALARINNHSISFETINTAIDIVNLNVTETTQVFEKHSDLYQISKEDLEQLAAAAKSSSWVVEQFQYADHFYRTSDLLWGDYGIQLVGKETDRILETLKNASSVNFALVNHFWERLPLGATFAAETVNLYRFFTEQSEPRVKIIVNYTEEALPVLNNLLTSIDKIQTRLEDVPFDGQPDCLPDEADSPLCKVTPSLMLATYGHMRKAVQWVEAVLKLAEEDYKNVLHEVSTGLDQHYEELRSYHSFFPAKKVLSKKRMEEVWKLERAQIDAYVQQVHRVENMTNEVKEQLHPKDGQKKKLAQEFEAAMQLGIVRDWWV